MRCNMRAEQLELFNDIPPKKDRIEKLREFLQAKEKFGVNDSIIFFCGMLTGWFVLTIIAFIVMIT